MLTLYGHTFSRAHRVLWMLKELKVLFDHIPTDFQRGGTRTPEFLAINPNGRVPALVDGGEVIFESLAINLYLARKYGGALAPVDVLEEGRAIQWSLWAATEVEKPLLFTAANLTLFAPKDRRAADVEMGLARLDRPLRVLDGQLAQRPYLLGDRFTVADLNVAALMSLIPLAKLSLTPYPRVDAWLSQCLERPAAADWKDIHFTVPRPSDDKLLSAFM